MVVGSAGTRLAELPCTCLRARSVSLSTLSKDTAMNKTVLIVAATLLSTAAYADRGFKSSDQVSQEFSESASQAELMQQPRDIYGTSQPAAQYRRHQPVDQTTLARGHDVSVDAYGSVILDVHPELTNNWRVR
jgi:hypothetical protein